MGFNAVILIDTGSLSRIAADPDFGARLADLMDQAAAPAPRPGNTHRLSDIAAEVPYEIEIGAPFHADQMVAHEIIGSRLIRHGHRRAGKGADLQHMAARLAAMGHPRSDMDDEALTPEPYRYLQAPDARTGLVSLLVLFDAIHEIRADQTLGARLALEVVNYAAQAGALIDLHGRMRGLQAGLGISDTVFAGNHSNPLTIIGLTPIDSYDLLVAGGNFGMMLRPEGDIHDLLGGTAARDRRRELREERLVMVQNMPRDNDRNEFDGPQ